ncbi:hypothetical protein DO97_01830 [Neosynechococcus sphagnicola sy1]|uniref:Uncharacterized protein n=1 Tax=Neosynechococcus sphagnicola sy1 TaxID=1497020 RepID=A0A098TLC7_9CYAN|nr:hypothetical protein DO97_01830 [Neosynechococcus sphagnicola sy1]
MRSVLFPLIGAIRQFMPGGSAVLLAKRAVKKLNGSGSIGDRPSMGKIIHVNGRSFTNVAVVVPGGLGAAIVRPLS